MIFMDPYNCIKAHSFAIKLKKFGYVSKIVVFVIESKTYEKNSFATVHSVINAIKTGLLIG